MHEEIETYLKSEITAGSFPSATWVVGDSRKVFASGAEGLAVAEPKVVEARLDTIYDVASLTKPVVTATLALVAVEKKLVRLDEQVGRHIDELADSPFSQATWVDFLSHTSGIDSWYPLYTKASDRESYLREILSLPLSGDRGVRVVYSDLGYLILQIALERLFGAGLDELAKEHVFGPLGMTASLFRPPAQLRERIAATERDNAFERKMVRAKGIAFDAFREGIIHGEVNDGNAWGMGGVCGHAGLFSTAGDLFEFGRGVLNGDFLVGRGLLELSCSSHTEGLNDRRGLGWELRTEANPASVLSTRSFGHTGFTGASLFIDPEADRVMVLLTNRLHPLSSGRDMIEVRREFHRLAVGGGRSGE